MPLGNCPGYIVGRRWDWFSILLNGEDYESLSNFIPEILRHRLYRWSAVISCSRFVFDTLRYAAIGYNQLALFLQTLSQFTRLVSQHTVRYKFHYYTSLM